MLKPQDSFGKEIKNTPPGGGGGTQGRPSIHFSDGGGGQRLEKCQIFARKFAI